MDRRAFLIVPTIFAGSHMLTGCATPQEPPSSAPRQATVAMPPIAFIIPSEMDVIITSNTNITAGSVGLALINQSRMVGDNRRELAQYKFSGDQTTVERRTETKVGVTGSGQKIRAKKSISQIPGGKRIEFTPYERLSYQDRMMGALPLFPAPSFEPDDIKAFFLTSRLYDKFEIDSEFNPEATYANFVRLLKSRPYEKGEKDPVSGKIFKQQFLMPFHDKEVPLAVETYPYRSGSKAIVYCQIPAIETTPNTVDFVLLLTEVRKNLTQIIKS